MLDDPELEAWVLERLAEWQAIAEAAVARYEEEADAARSDVELLADGA